jgi:hypothetical protein
MSRQPLPRRIKRLILLLACILIGLIIGIVGSMLTGSSAWYAAIPAVVATGWWFVADPTKCCNPSTQRRD